MLKYCKSLWTRLRGAWMVLQGGAVVIPVFEDDTTIVVIETEGSSVSFMSCRSFVESEDSYNVLLSKLLVWMGSKNRFFWTGDKLGSQVRTEAEEYFEEHKNKG